MNEFDAFSVYTDRQKFLIAFNLISHKSYRCRCGVKKTQFTRYIAHIAPKLGLDASDYESIRSETKVYFKDPKTKRYHCPHPNCRDKEFDSDGMSSHLIDDHEINSEFENWDVRKQFYEWYVEKKVELAKKKNGDMPKKKIK